MENALLKNHTELRKAMLARRDRVIEHYRGRYPVSDMCAFFGISRAGYYAWRHRMDRPGVDAERKELIQEAYQASKQTYGYRRIGLWLREKREVVINHKAILRLMNQLGIRSIARRRKPYRKMSQLEGKRRGNCWDNAPMENFFDHLKEEALRHIPTSTFEELKEIIEEYIHFLTTNGYN